MRDFQRTAEPAGAERTEARGDRFVVQEHHATALHWDFRLERDGVLVSWAVPKGLPPHPAQNHLAVHTEDHPLDYIDFEGEIPEGEYGGGQVMLWDQGTYECEKFNEREVIVVLHGRRARGRYVLVKTGGKNWLMHRMDPPDDPTREPMPSGLSPMLPTTRKTLPECDSESESKSESDWLFEPAWGGERVLLACEGGRVVLTAADGADVTERFPEFRALGRALGSLALILDGEVVVLDGTGRPDPALLARRKARPEQPAVFFASDLVWLDGHPAVGLPASDRRTLLAKLDFGGPTWRTNPTSDGQALLAAAGQQGLPGVYGRSAASAYEPGQTSPEFVFVPVPAKDR
ncbi:MAG: bifunctional non-ous end joining protein LigD [Acidimicrobiaceae bacterium]|nr:bifunctional non-ous end joining protein LigD [Acidimicrobiaceae bacterium]